MAVWHKYKKANPGISSERAASWPIQVKNYFEELQLEMKRVTWPSWKQVRATTAGRDYRRRVCIRRLLRGGGHI
jgi:hypothetical protein